ncbi:MAG: FAD-dependent oxidoreductase [Lachnospiraceae bacterium]|nr:FAD-dependent oxidoreductase [Lachnospiraceae bacterium]
MGTLQIESPGTLHLAYQQFADHVTRKVQATPRGVCPVDLTLNALRMSHVESCGKCTPCRIGLARLADMIEEILDGEGDENSVKEIEELANVIRDTADCAIGYEAANLVLNSLKYFREDYERHVIKSYCLYTMDNAIPCAAICPAHVDVPGYIALTRDGRCEDAVKLIRRDNPFPSVCGYVCEHPCEDHCRRSMVDAPINICGIKRYAVDHAGEIETPKREEETGKKIAVVGGGPGGLTTAYFLRLMGHSVTVYEQREKLGGMLRYGIPDYRLPQEILDNDIKYIVDTGVEVKLNTNIGNDITIEELKKNFDAVYVSIGAHDDKKLRIEGEDGKGVVPAVSMLRSVGKGEKLDFSGKRVVVIGGGNVAMDATRTSLRLGADSVTTVYRRRIFDMTALPEEIEEAQMEGAEILTLLAPDHVELNDAGEVTALFAQPQIISSVGDDGRTGVRKADKDLVRIPCDIIVVAIGQAIDAGKLKPGGIETERGVIKADLSTFVPDSGNVFAGGDAVSGPATVIRAIAAGKVAAKNIDGFLGFDHKITVDVDIPSPDLSNKPACGRVTLKGRHISKIADDFDLVSEGMSEEEMLQECGRCLRCDHFGLGIFKGGRIREW